MTRKPQILSEKVCAHLRRTSTATLASQLLKRGFRNTFLPDLKPLRPDLRMVGYAFTLRYAPAREDFGITGEYDNSSNIQRLAVEAVGKDDVLLIDARGDVRAASFGHILGTRLLQRGAAGLVTDGALRDSPSFRDLRLPTYGKAFHAATSAVAHYPADMNVPIGCSGVLVTPGDIAVGDGEGVIIIPASVAEEVAEDAFEQELLEEFVLERIQGGASIKGVYPPNEEMLRQFSRWLADRRSSVEG